MNTRSLVPILALGLALPLAIWLGVSVAQDQVQTVLWIVGVAFLALCLALGRHVWILIPASLGLSGGLNFLPGSPPPWAFMTLVVGVFSMLRILARKQPLRIRWTGMDTALFIVALTILQAFIRNPTGLAVFGGDVAGGKAYVVYAVAFAAWVLMGMADADLRSWRWAVLAFIGASILDGFIAIGSSYSVTFAKALVRFYSNVNFTAISSYAYTTDMAETRISQFTQLGGALGLIASTFWRPLAALDLTKPWRGAIALAGLLFTVMSGFRSQMARFIVNIALGSLLRKKILDVVVLGGVGALLVALLAIAVPSASLPYSVQRILTVVPGYKARSDIASEAKGSMDVRFKAWKLALFTDRYIANKILGDGFQMSESELKYVSTLRENPRLAVAVHYEDVLLATGDYHGFHAESVRVTGVVGLIAATASLIAFALAAMRSIKWYQYGPEWGYVLFICMPFLIEPFWYWLVFGSYKVGFPVLIAQAGMLKVLSNIQRT